jgi:hypothetical protein
MSAPGFAPEQAADHLPQRRLVAVGAASVVILLVAIAAAGLLLRVDRPDHGRATAPLPARAPDEIGHVEQSLVESTRRGLDLQDRQRAALGRYGWVDRDAGIARIPIERAIDLTLERSP